MAHVKQFQGIPMSKSMRGLCKEEDYAFLGTPKSAAEETPEVERTQGDVEWRDDKEERLRRRQQREQREKQKLREIEAGKKEKEQQWRTHIAELASTQEKTLQDRLARIRKFREFQKKVLVEESGTIDGAATAAVDQLLTRM